MKKIYFMTMLVIATLVSLSAQATTVYLQTDEASSGKIQITDATNGIDVTLTNAAQEVTYPGSGGNFTLTVKDGWVLKEVNYINPYNPNGLSQALATFYEQSTFSTDWRNLSYDNTMYTFVAVDPATIVAKEVTFQGTPGSFTVYSNKDYSTYTTDAATGKTEPISWKNPYNFTFNVTATDGYKITSIKDQTGYEYVSNAGSSVSISTQNFTEEQMTLTVTTAELYDSKLTFNVDGDISKVYIYEAGSYNARRLNSNNQEFGFERGKSYYAYNYTTPYDGFYKFEINGTPVDKDSSNHYNFTPNDGDVINITVEAPPTYVNFTLTLDEGVTEGIISSVTYDNKSMTLAEIMADDFKPAVGKRMILYFNNAKYTNMGITVNNVYSPITTPSYGTPQYNIVFENQNYDVKLSGEVIRPYNVTIKTNEPGKFSLVYGSYPYTTLIPTEESTEIEVDQKGNRIQLTNIQEGYYISSVTSSNSACYTSTSDIQINGDTEITIVVSELIRDRKATVYLEDGAEWRTKSFALSNTNYPIRKQYTLTPGENEIEFGSFDTFSADCRYGSNYTLGNFYFNGEASNDYFNNDVDIPDGSIIKIFAQAPTTYDVNYTIDEDVNVLVKHEVSEIASPASHKMLHGTKVRIVPVTSFAARSNENEEPITVSVNNVPVQSVNGEYPIEITDHSEIAVKNNVNTGVEEIEAAESGDVKTYNLQGVEVKGDRLPAGIYIRGGKKVIVK